MLKRNVFLVASLLAAMLLGPNVSADGKTKAAACGACHGADGNSINPIWPSLAGQSAPYIVAQLKAFKSGSRKNPSMQPMVASLEEADMQEIADYYASLAPKISPMGDTDFSAAQTLYRGGDMARGLPACMACHGPNGAGNAPAGFPSLRGQQPAYTAAQLKAYRDGGRTPGRNDIMGDIAAKMTDDEIDGLAKYVSSLH